MLAAVLAGVVLGAIELTLRARGGLPSVPLSKNRWAAQLDEALDDPPARTTLIVGASRIRSGFSSRTFFERFPGQRLHYLASAGEAPTAALIHIASETDFAGRMIVSLHDSAFEPEHFLEQQHLVEYYEDGWNWSQHLDLVAGDAVSSNLVLRQENYSVANVLRTTVTRGELPSVPYWRRHNVIGESFYDFSLVDDVDAFKPTPIAEWAQVENPDWFARMRLVVAAISRLRERGASVAVVRLQTSGIWWSNDRLRWPRERYWDRFAAAVGDDAIVVHFEDEPSLQFSQPDDSHIDERDKPALTEALLAILSARGMQWQ